MWQIDLRKLASKDMTDLAAVSTKALAMLVPAVLASLAV